MPRLWRFEFVALRAKDGGCVASLLHPPYAPPRLCERSWGSFFSPPSLHFDFVSHPLLFSVQRLEFSFVPLVPVVVKNPNGGRFVSKHPNKKRRDFAAIVIFRCRAERDGAFSGVH
jgi:hypothetical protein